MTIIRVGLDTSKHVFQIHGVDENEQAVLRRQLRRGAVEKFFAELPSTRIGIEACGASHHWARRLRGLGHEVLLMPPQSIKAYVKRGKNDAIDAAAICEAMSRPTMRFVPVKTVEQQAALTMLGVRDMLVKQRTMLINAIRGHAAEFGVTAAKSLPSRKRGCRTPKPFARAGTLRGGSASRRAKTPRQADTGPARSAARATRICAGGSCSAPPRSSSRPSAAAPRRGSWDCWRASQRSWRRSRWPTKWPASSGP